MQCLNLVYFPVYSTESPTYSKLFSGAARHTSRSAGNLLSTQLDGKEGRLSTSLQQSAANGVYSSRLTTSEQAATGLRTPRSGLRPTSRLQTPAKQTTRSTSLHAPRYSEGGPQSRLAALSVRQPTNSLPSSPHSSEQDLDDNYGSG